MSDNGIGKVACVRVKPRYAPSTTWTALDVLDENAQAGGWGCGCLVCIWTRRRSECRQRAVTHSDFSASQLCPEEEDD